MKRTRPRQPSRKRMMQRINALPQRHGRIWQASRWIYQHRAWLDGQSFTEPVLQAALRTYLRHRMSATPI